MRMQVLNLDGGVLGQDQFMEAHRPEVVDLRTWGPKLRMGCSFRAFREFERDLARMLPRDNDAPTLNFIGSGDFHHVSLALTRRLREPAVLLILDHHPDWMVGVPFLHCGTWVQHALKSTCVERIIHLGGETDFDNAFRWMAPRRAILDGRITVVPGRREFQRGFWSGIPQERLTDPVDHRLTDRRLAKLVDMLLPLVANRAVYVSLDKDVLRPEEAAVNWDSGVMRLTDAMRILAALEEQCEARIVGMDIVGDWSPVKMSGLFRRGLHWLEHEPDAMDTDRARKINEETNSCLADFLRNLTRFSNWQRKSSEEKFAAPSV